MLLNCTIAPVAILELESRTSTTSLCDRVALTVSVCSPPSMIRIEATGRGGGAVSVSRSPPQAYASAATSRLPHRMRSGTRRPPVCLVMDEKESGGNSECRGEEERAGRMALSHLVHDGLAAYSLASASLLERG